MAIGPYYFPLSPGTTYDPRGLKPEPEYGQAAQDVSELIKTMQEIKRQKYERNLYQGIMDQLSNKDTNGESKANFDKIQSLLNEGKTVEAAAELSKLTQGQPIQIPELMKKRFEKKPSLPLGGGFGKQVLGRTGRILKGIGKGLVGTLTPFGEYTGPITPTEQTVVKSQQEYNKYKNLADYFKILETILQLLATNCLQHSEEHSNILNISNIILDIYVILDINNS